LLLLLIFNYIKLRSAYPLPKKWQFTFLKRYLRSGIHRSNCNKYKHFYNWTPLNKLCLIKCWDPGTEALPKEIIKYIIYFLDPNPVLLATFWQACKKFFNVFILLNLEINNERDFEQEPELSGIIFHKEQIETILSCDSCSFDIDWHHLNFSRLKFCGNFMIKTNMMSFNEKLTITGFHAAKSSHIDFLRADRKTSKTVPGNT
jgi:hypothetical protein